MTTEGDSEAAAAPAAAQEAERTRQRALANLQEVSRRMVQLGTMVSDGKTAAELAAMSAWVSAFGCQLAGVPLELARAPLGELLLMSVELQPRSEKEFDAHAIWPGERLIVHQLCAASGPAALALGLVGLARHVLDDCRASLPTACDSDVRHRRAEDELLRRLEEAVLAYDDELAPPEPPSVNAHGMARED